MPLDQPTAPAAEVAEAIEKAGGCLVGSYKEPLRGHAVLLSILSIDAVEPTPFQRDLSDAHHKRLADVINKTGLFLDPIIAVVAPKRAFADCALDTDVCQAYISHMALSSQDWQTVKAKLMEMEQVIEALRKLRDGHIGFPVSVLNAIDNAIAESEKRVNELKKAKAD